MNYKDTVSWMFLQLPMYQNKGKSAFRKDLSNTVELSKHLHHPHKNFKSIHVAGTNGKGSTSHMLASILQEAGYKVGLYTSPHLKDFRERIRINGKEVSKQFVIGFIKRNKSFIESHNLSFFEMTVGMAFDYFSRKHVDIAIIEVGMGGRLDSTNIITPILSVITNIGFDHTQYLGDTREKIASEKAGIIKNNIPVVIGETHLETASVFRKTSEARSSQIYFADQLVDVTYDSDLKGMYQKHNIKTVIQSIEVLKSLGYKVSDSHLKNGLLKVMTNTNFKGRWQILGMNPKIICDTAHNTEGLSYTTTQLKDETFSELHIVFGVVSDKDLKDILKIMPRKAIYYFCKPNVERGLDAKLLRDIFEKNGFQGSVFESVEQALSEAKQNAKKEDLIYLGGSTFVVAEII
ncbi:bifunctional folylpolyglutamate synthase/dihydrofolate synthase [Winogradskyella aurantia]|uniref:Dihydrofolate synthase/folylpolyglutamate synthase n=1 Tax=Winogradskyella aurantia TaxID=1915063 RepID=A0A265UNQ2_9FLAO|nr:folylpolyglutamate synthase/dihydrofolate synthase family protein [Winogradskyella aurantia]OZV66918.1 tetrahydrofolate synthase [Winogradskyella aurantia]